MSTVTTAGAVPGWKFLPGGPWDGSTGATVNETTLGGTAQGTSPATDSLGSSTVGLPYSGFIVPGGLGAFQPPSGTAGGSSSLLPLLLVGVGVVAFLWWRSRGA